MKPRMNEPLEKRGVAAARGFFKAVAACLMLAAVLPLSSCGGGDVGDATATGGGTAAGGAGSANSGGQTERWRDEGVRVAGNYADNDVVELPGGGWRMYFAAEPEVPGFQGQVYSAISADGLAWTREDGVRMLNSTFPSVTRMADGRWRMYFQSSSGGKSAILSAVSPDGLNWTGEAGSRIRQGQQGEFDTVNVADPVVLELPGGGWLMVYRGQAGQNSYGREGPNPGTIAPNDFLLSAVSSDGLDWTVKNLIVDSRNPQMRGQILGPELVLDGSEVRFYCNSFEGIYTMSLDREGKPLGEPKLVMRSTGPAYAPGDVSVIRMGDVWRMYYGLHTKGIHSARRE